MIVVPYGTMVQKLSGCQAPSFSTLRLGPAEAQKETVGLQAGARGQPGPGRGKRGAKQEPRLDAPPTLTEAKIDKKLSSRAQKLAALPTEEFEDRVTDWRARSEYGADRVTTNLMREPKAPKPAPNVVPISQDPRIDRCMATIRRLILETMDDLKPEQWPALFTEYRASCCHPKMTAAERRSASMRQEPCYSAAIVRCTQHRTPRSFTNCLVSWFADASCER
jgi:hypothetical protein